MKDRLIVPINQNPNPPPVGARFGFLLLGIRVLTGLNDKCSKIKVFRAAGILAKRW